MHKQLQAHYRLTLAKIREFENLLANTNHDSEEYEKLRWKLRALRRYHQTRVHDFQHERLIHLLVTLFFGGLFLFFLYLFFTFVIAGPFVNKLTIVSLLGFLALLLLVTELFYIRHYYQLENGVQKLYELTERLEKTREQ